VGWKDLEIIVAIEQAMQMETSTEAVEFNAHTLIDSFFSTMLLASMV
jgi:hypothetical protein